MDPKSGQIFKVSDAAEARRRGLVPIHPSEVEALQAMTDSERIEWLRQKNAAEAAKRAELAGGNRKKRRTAAALARRAKKKGKRR